MSSLQINFWVVVLLVVLAVSFDFMNGFHDAANSIATVVSTGVLKPQRAVLFAAFFNVVAIAVSTSTWRPPSARASCSPAWSITMWCSVR